MRRTTLKVAKTGRNKKDEREREEVEGRIGGMEEQGLKIRRKRRAMGLKIRGR